MARAIVTFGRSWHTLAIVRSLGRQGIDVFCGEEAPFAPSFFSKYCTDNFRYPSVSEDPEGFLDALEAKVIELKPEDPNEPYVLIPVHKETWLIAKHRERFEPHIKLALTSYENMAQTHDKGQFALLAEELGILIPETLQPQDISEVYALAPQLSYPQFVKVREGASGVGVERVDGPEELTTTFRRFVEEHGLAPESFPLIQAGVPGQDYCVTALFDRGRCVASMTYRNVRAFPRETGAGALRETVDLPEAEGSAIRLLEHLGWHGIAELDFRKAEGSPAHLIELNPRFFGGLPQACAAKVDYPHLLFQVACGEETGPAPVPDPEARTETPVVGLLATLQEIAHDEERLELMRRLRDEGRTLGHAKLSEARFRPFFRALRKATSPKDIRRLLKENFAKHHGAINDVIHADDPMPALGVLYPIALMLKHGKLSMGMLTSEPELAKPRKRRSLRSQLRRPQWRTAALTAGLFALASFTQSWALTADNLGLVMAWPQRLGGWLFGGIQDTATLFGALRQTGGQVVSLLFLYLCAAFALREGLGAVVPEESEEREFVAPALSILRPEGTADLLESRCTGAAA